MYQNGEGGMNLPLLIFYQRRIYMDYGREIKRGDIWRHFKGFVIRIIEPSVFNTETNDEYVVYKEISSNRKWARPKAMFLEELDHSKYPDIKDKYRFTKIAESKKSTLGKK